MPTKNSSFRALHLQHPVQPLTPTAKKKASPPRGMQAWKHCRGSKPESNREGQKEAKGIYLSWVTGEHFATGPLQRGAVTHTAICGLRELLLLQRARLRTAECPPGPDPARSPTVSGVICKEPRVPSPAREGLPGSAGLRLDSLSPAEKTSLVKSCCLNPKLPLCCPRGLVLRHVSCCCKAQLSKGNAPVISNSCCFGFGWKQRVGERNLLSQGSKKL